MKYTMSFIIVMLLSFFLTSCTKENRSALKNNKIQTISDEEMTAIVKNSVAFKDNSKVEKKIAEIDKDIQRNPSNKNALLVKKAGYEIVSLKYDDAKQTLLQVTADKNGHLPLFAIYRLGIVEFLLGNDESAHNILSQLKKNLVRTKADNVQWFFLRVDPLLKVIDKKEKYQKSLQIQVKTPIANQKNCFFMDINPENYAVSWSGKCKNGFVDGYGVLKYSDGTVFVGFMKKGVMTKGTYHFTDGTVFEGTFKRGLQASGCLLYKNGYKYCGKFKQDLPSGEGQYFSNNNDKIQGLFEKGRPVKGVAFCADGRKTQYKVSRSLDDGRWIIVFNCREKTKL